jgi:hypothetical protein
MSIIKLILSVDCRASGVLRAAIFQSMVSLLVYRGSRVNILDPIIDSSKTVDSHLDLAIERLSVLRSTLGIARFAHDKATAS